MNRFLLLCFLLVSSSVGLFGQIISVSDTEFSQTLTVPDSAQESFTISNDGIGDLNYTITGQNTSLASPLSILLYDYNLNNDFSTTVTMDNLRGVLNAELPSAIITETDTEDPALLASLLAGKGVFLVPRVRTCDPSVFTGFQEVLDDYVNAGGNVVFLGTDDYGQSTINHIVFNSGLFDGTINGFLTTGTDATLEILEPGHPIADGVAPDLQQESTTYHFSIANEDANRIVGVDLGSSVSDVVVTRSIGEGKAVLLGFTYFNTNEELTKLLVNTLKFTGIANENYWLDVSPTSGTVAPGESATIDLLFDATLIPAGDYTVELIVSHNDSTQDPIVITCNLSTNGVAAIAVPGEVSFGNVVQSTSKSITVDVFNPGADTLFVSNVSLSGDFPITFSPTSFWVYPTLTTPIVLTYSPEVVESFSVDLTIENNVQDQVVTVTGNGTGAPTMALSDTDIVYDIDAGNVESTNITLTNDGLGDLEYDIETSLSSGLLLSFFADNYDSGSIQISDVESGETVLEISFEAVDNIQFPITTLGSAGEYSLEVFGDSGPGSVFVQNLTLTDLVTGEELIDEIFLGTGDPRLFNGATPNWLAANPSSGVVAFVQSGTNSGDVEIVFDATGLIEGTYIGEIIINPNEPLNPQTINVTLNVTGVAAVAVDQETLDFGPVLDGLTNDLIIEIQNPGTAPLEVTGIDFGSGAYSSVLNNFTVQAQQSVAINILFSPDMEGNFDSTMTLETNAGDLVVNLLGEGIGAPAASVSPGFMEFFLISGDMLDTSFTVLNQGQGPLLYNPGVGTSSSGYEITITAGPDGANVFYFLGPAGELIDAGADETVSVQVTGLDSNSSYTLDFFENAGSVVEMICTDLATGEVVASSNGVGFFDLGMPAFLSWLNVNDEGQELDFPGETLVPFSIDATGLSSGDYPNSIVINSNDPTNPTVALEILLHISAFPSAAFGSNTTLQCGESGIQFMDESLNIPTSFFWDFGDGNTSTEQNPFHTYLEGGAYDVMFVGCNTLGCDTLDLPGYIVADLACQQVSVQNDENQVIQACNGFVYDSGGPDGPYFNNSYGEVTIAPPGANTITLSFTEFEFEQPFDGILIFDGPDTSSPLLGEFTGTTAPPDITSSGGSLTIVENSDANVGLDGFTAIFSCSAPAVAPTAAFTIEPTSTCSGLLACADNSGNFPTSWAWDFGDGETSNAPNPNHQYTSGGTYTVSLEVCNDTGCDTITEDVSLDVLYPQVEAPFNTIGIDEAIQFQDNTEGATLWVWEFGDGTQSVGQNPVHAYSSQGVYTLTVTIQNTNIADCTVVYEQDIYVDIAFGIEDGELFNLDCYPNPSSNELIVDLSLDNESKTIVSMFDCFGRRLYSEAFFAKNLNEKINVASYPAGIYNLLIDVNGEQIVRRIVVAR